MDSLKRKRWLGGNRWYIRRDIREFQNWMVCRRFSLMGDTSFYRKWLWDRFLMFIENGPINKKVMIFLTVTNWRIDKSWYHHRNVPSLSLCSATHLPHLFDKWCVIRCWHGIGIFRHCFCGTVYPGEGWLSGVFL